VVAVLPPVPESRQGCDEPEEGAGKINPNGVLHASDISVTLGILINVHLAKHAKEGDPEDE
jgi:hypothetical protein